MNRHRRRKIIDRKPTRRNALNTQAYALALLGSTGEELQSLVGNQWLWRDQELLILCFSRDAKLPSPTDATGASFLRRKLVLQHCIAVSWKGKAVFRLRWADDGRVVINVFDPGPWIEALLVAVASDPAIPATPAGGTNHGN